MSAVTASSLPANTLALKDLQGVGTLEAQIYNASKSVWETKSIQSNQDVEEFEAIFQQVNAESTNIKYVVPAGSEDFANNKVSQIAPKSGTIANTPRLIADLSTCDNKFVYLEESNAYPVNRIIAGCGMFVVSNTVTEEFVVVKLSDLLSNQTQPTVVGSSFVSIINPHFKLHIAAQDEETSGSLRDLSLAFEAGDSATFTALNITGTINVTLKQINGTNASVSSNTVILASTLAPTPNVGYGNLLTVTHVTMKIVDQGSGVLGLDCVVEFMA